MRQKTLLKTQIHEQNYKYSLGNLQLFLRKTSQYSWGLLINFNYLIINYLCCIKFG